MYQHHKDSIERMVRYFKEKEEVTALILGGSVAKGCERPDSDLDALVVVSPEAYRKRVKENRTVELIWGECTYEGGYFDTKYMQKEYLEHAAERASEPTRNSFIKARVLFSKDPEIEGIVNRIPVFQKKEKDEKMRSFYSNYMVNLNYFLRVCRPEGYMKMRVCSEILYSVYRMILQEQEVLFPCNRRLEETVAGLSDRPEHILELGKKLAEEMTVESAEEFAAAYRKWSRYPHVQNADEVQSRYTADFEQWWEVPRPLIAEW